MMSNFRRQLESIKKNQMEIIQLKNMSTEVRVNKTEERIYKLGGWSLETWRLKHKEIFKGWTKTKSHIEIQRKSRIYLLLKFPERVKKGNFAEAICEGMLTNNSPKRKKGTKPQIQTPVQSLSLKKDIENYPLAPHSKMLKSKENKRLILRTPPLIIFK